MMTNRSSSLLILADLDPRTCLWRITVDASVSGDRTSARWRACGSPSGEWCRETAGIGLPGLFRGPSKISYLTMADASRDRVVPVGVGRHQAATSP
jgi:hypothetical protein